MIVDYDPLWPVVFADLKRVIETTLGGLALSVEHVGSTAVPGLAAKPIIDLDVVIESEAGLAEVIDALSGLGYCHEGDLGIEGRQAFGRASHDVPYDDTGRTWPSHHLYVCPQQSQELARHLVFRDYMREHLDDALEYATLKHRLAEQFRHDMNSYVEGKGVFIERILRDASQGRP